MSAPRPTAGTLFLIPTPLGDATPPDAVLPAPALGIARRLDYFVAENARSARAFLKALPSEHALQSIEIRELNEHTRADDVPAMLTPLLAGRDGGVLSEAGCPAVADPGALLVAEAHRRGVPVMPLAGPSSLVLALMASGLDGQRFAFAGYPPVKEAERDAFLRALEQRSARGRETQLLIEAPYRSQALLDALLRVLAPETVLVVARELTQPDQRIDRRSVAAWRAARPELGKVPAVFLFQAAPYAGGAGAHPARRTRPSAKPGGLPAGPQRPRQ